MRRCVQCGSDVPGTTTMCPSCGRQQPIAKPAAAAAAVDLDVEPDPWPESETPADDAKPTKPRGRGR